MGLFKGGALRLFQTFLYAVLFCCAGIILGIYSYFLAVLANRHEVINVHWKAVEGLSGAATLYLIFAVLLTCCFGGISFLAFMAIVLDICFVGAMIAIAIMTRDGAHSCSGTVTTPIGTGASGSGTGYGGNATYAVHLGTACRLNTAAFAVSIIAAVLFLCTAALQLALVKNHKKEKRFGPSPQNNYTSGYGSKKRRGLFGRRNKSADTDSELGPTGTAVGAGALPPATPVVRPSHETGYTGSTVAAPGHPAFDKNEGHPAHAPHGSHGGYYTQPQGTGVNPYGYENNHYSTGTATNY